MSPQERAPRRSRFARNPQFQTLKEFSEATGQDRHSVEIDFSIFQNAASPDPNDPRKLYKPSDFDFELRPGSAAVDAGERGQISTTISPDALPI